MRLSGEGTIFQRKDGRWCARVSVAGIRHIRYAHDRETALRHLQELRAAHLLGALVRPTGLTLAAYLDEWLTASAPRLAPSTVESYGQLSRHLKPLAHLRLGRVEPRHLVVLYGALLRRGLSAGRVLKLHRVLHKVLGDAVRWKLIGQNPAAAVDPPHPDDHQPPLWTLAQVRAFLAGCQECDRPDARLLAFLLLSGLRLGEALALTWSHLDMEAGTVLVERGLTHVHGKPVEGPPKTKAGNRGISLPTEASELLRRQHAVQLERRLATGPAWQGCERVWTTAVGTAPLRGNVRRSLHGLCDGLGLPRIRVHDLRHLHATLLVAGGVDVKAAQRRMGHASLRMTLNVYARALPEADIAAAQAVSRLVQG